jgi:ribose transport system permease protein
MNGLNFVNENKRGILNNFFNIIVLVFLIVVTIVFSLTIDNFFTLSCFNNITRSITILGIIAAGMTLAILSGGIDLSVGAIMAFSISMGGLLIENGWPFIAVYIFIILSGLSLGLINGVLISRLPVPAIVITLGTANLYRGVTMVVTDGEWVTPIPFVFRKIAQGYNPFIILVVVFAVLTFITLFTKFGRNIYAIGSNEQAAVFSGVTVKRYKVYVYTILGVLCALAGILFMGRSGTIQPQVGAGYEMQTIAAVVIGGTSVYGGEGGVIRTAVGAVLIGVILVALSMIGVDPFWQDAVTGGLIIVAIVLDSLRKIIRNR